jgi:hypothetical protein
MVSMSGYSCAVLDDVAQVRLMVRKVQGLILYAQLHAPGHRSILRFQSRGSVSSFFGNTTATEHTTETTTKIRSQLWTLQDFEFGDPTNPTNARNTSCHRAYFTALKRQFSSSEPLSTAQNQTPLEQR